MYSAPPAKSSTATCATCGGAIPADVPFGQCPKCLIGLGLSCKADPDEGPPVPFSIVEAEGDFDYELLERIGRGGMGLVYRARQRSLNRIVAVKVMAAGEFASPAALARFRREAETAAKLDHPNIVAIIEVGENNTTPFLVMRLVQGDSLAGCFSDFALPDQTAVVGEHQAQIRIARLISTVARAVDYAHRRGVLHRDLKPSNILLDADGNPHLTDFGIAKCLEDEAGITQTSELLGTLSYMAPEQAAGKRVSRGADIYSLGAILFELLTGQPPFSGPKMEVLRQVLEEDPPKPRVLNRTVDRDLATICMKCLDKHPVRRYHSALELAEDLERWLRHDTILARQAGPLLRLQRWTFRNPAVATLLVSLSVGIAVSLILLARANEEKMRKSIALDILRTESARQLQEIWASASSSFRIKSETLAAMAGMEVTVLTDFEDRFTIGLVSQGNPLDRVLRAAPVFRELEHSMSALHETPVRMDLSLYKAQTNAIDDLVKGRVDFAQLNPLAFLRARELARGIRPLVIILPEPGVNDAAIIFTRKNTGIRSLAQLRGKSFLLGSSDSTLSFWTKVNLVGADVRSSHLARYRYIDQFHDITPSGGTTPGIALGNPFSAMTPVEAVIAGFYDASVVTEKRFREVAAEQELVALARFPDSGDLLVARENLPQETAARFQRALLGLTDSATHGSIFNTSARFKKASDEDYREIHSRLSAEAAFNQ
jgi:serine/threonine protein kinase